MLTWRARLTWRALRTGRSRPARYAPPARCSLASILCALACGCTGGKVIALGDVSPPPYHFGPPVLVAELASSGSTENPTLTGDLLEIFFTTDRAGTGSDVWFATRGDVSQPFAAPAPVAGVNSSAFETSSAISADGLTLWFGSDRAGGEGSVDVWVSTRAGRADAWSTPLNVVALNSPAMDIPRPLGQHGSVMPLASTRATPDLYQTYLAARLDRGAPFGPPVAIPELAYPNRSTVDGCLTDDGLTLFYSSSAATDATDAAGAADAGAPVADLYVAWRRSVGEPFSVTQPLGDLNTPADERDPWLSPDGRQLYFTSDRDGVLSIYVAPVVPP